MKRLITLCALVALFATPLAPLHAATVFTHLSALSAGTLIKGSGSAVYYYTKAGTRLSFPNEKTYFTWYTDFSNVATITDAELAEIKLAGNVTYRPGSRMIKVQSDPRTYVVDDGGTLRWVQTEQIATSLYGSDWAKKIDDLSDAFFGDYQTGVSVSSASGFNPTNVQASHPGIESTTPVVTTDDKGIVDTRAVTTGDTFTITLNQNASTGYAWTPTYDTSAIALVSSTTSQANTAVVGSSGTITFTFKALSAGQKDIVFAYARSWETNVAPIEKQTYRINIGAAPVVNATTAIVSDRTQAQANATITITASSTASPRPSSIEISVNALSIKTCSGASACTVAYGVPSVGLPTNFTFSALFTMQDGTTSTKYLVIPTVSEERSDAIAVIIARPIMRVSSMADITIRPSADLHAQEIAIYIDGSSPKKCSNGPSECKFVTSISGIVGSVHTVEAVVKTTGNLFYRSVQKTITLADNDAPSITLEAAKSSIYASETVDITLRANDDDGIQSTKILRNGSVLATCTGAAPCTVTAGPFNLAVGSTISFDGVATDLLGLTTTSTGLATVKIQ